jgi:hypothetical protein
VLVLVWLELIRSVRVLMRFQYLIGMRVLVPLVAGMIVRVFVHMAMSVFMAVRMAMAWLWAWLWASLPCRCSWACAC